MACLMLLIVAALIALERQGRRRRDFAVSAQDPRRVARITLTGPARWAATIACCVPVVLGFLLPAGYLLREVIGPGRRVGLGGALARHARTPLGPAAAP